MSGAIHLNHSLRDMSFHGPHARAKAGRRRFLNIATSVSVFALTLGISDKLNANYGFSLAYSAGPNIYRPALDDSLPAAFDDLAPMDDSALETARGGFAVGNVNVNVGVTVETTIDGFVTVTTNFNMSMPGMFENMGTEIKSVAEAATEAANAAIDAANTAVAASTSGAASDWQNSGTNPDATPTTVSAGEITTASQTLNGTPATVPVTPTIPAPLADNPTVAQAMDALEQGIKNITAAPPPVTAPPASSPPASQANSQANSQAAPPPTAPVKTSPVPNQTTTPVTNTVTAPVTAPVTSIVATSDKNANGGTVAVTELSKDGNKLVIPTVGANMAQVIHDTTNGHTSVITNTLNNVTIRQNVSMNMTVDNFTALQTASSLNRVVTSLSRQIGVMSLRR